MNMWIFLRIHSARQARVRDIRSALVRGWRFQDRGFPSFMAGACLPVGLYWEAELLVEEGGGGGIVIMLSGCRENSQREVDENWD